MASIAASLLIISFVAIQISSLLSVSIPLLPCLAQERVFFSFSLLFEVVFPLLSHHPLVFLLKKFNLTLSLLVFFSKVSVLFAQFIVLIAQDFNLLRELFFLLFVTCCFHQHVLHILLPQKGHLGLLPVFIVFFLQLHSEFPFLFEVLNQAVHLLLKMVNSTVLLCESHLQGVGLYRLRLALFFVVVELFLDRGGLLLALV
jgi:hypothetical protein